MLAKQLIKLFIGTHVFLYRLTGGTGKGVVVIFYYGW